MSILVTGGAGYIGSHTCIELLNNNYDVIVVDNLCNSSPESIKRVENITNKKIKFYKADVCDKTALRSIFNENKIDCVIHFAGLKAVGESVQKPLEYYDNNLSSTLTLLKAMNEYNVKKIVFSSSATVYSSDNEMPLTEDCKTGNCTNPYGWTKYIGEQIFRDLAKSDTEWSIALLRYFNPIGAHKSGLIGESPKDIPNNLMPYVSQVAVGKLKELSVFGNDYDTHDGTGVRDYIHVVDLAKGHVVAIDYINKHKGLDVFNLGTGVGYSVLDIVNAFEETTNQKVPYRITARRAGDLATVYSDPSKSKKLLGWEAENGIKDMCLDAWNWQKNNPNGYE